MFISGNTLLFALICGWLLIGCRSTGQPLFIDTYIEALHGLVVSVEKSIPPFMWVLHALIVPAVKALIPVPSRVPPPRRAIPLSAESLRVDEEEVNNDLTFLTPGDPVFLESCHA